MRCVKKHPKNTIMLWPTIQLHMVVKYITLSLASQCFIVPHVIVLSLILILSAIILACLLYGIIRFNSIVVAFGDEFVNSDIYGDAKVLYYIDIMMSRSLSCLMGCNSYWPME